MEKFIDEHRDQLIELTRELLKIRSVEEKPQESAPFGMGVKEALLKAIDISKSLGFKAVNLDNVLGYAEWGEGDDVISVLGHIDVVPEGRGWNYPPYGAEIHDGRIYARGAIDDKGPTIAALFGLYALKESNLNISKRVRIVFGTNEESGWKCMSYFKEKVKDPLVGFSPDATFPVINREKGILNITLRRDFENKNDILKVSGGERPNMVPDHAEAEFLQPFNIFVEHHDAVVEGNKIIAKGISAHGSLPENGVNAIVTLFEILDHFELNRELKEVVNFIVHNIGRDFYGKTLGVAMEDELSGHLTLNLGVINIDENFCEMTFNIRYPVTDNPERILKIFERVAAASGFKISNYNNRTPLFVDENDPLVQKLMKVYEECTGNNAFTISIGGATYARVMDKGVAFGPNFPGSEELAHTSNEFIDIELLVNVAKIYGRAIYELAK